MGARTESAVLLEPEVDGKPLYGRIADALRTQIQAGTLVDGERLMSEQRLGELFGGASRPTVRKATALLEREGYLHRQNERGLHIRRCPPVTVASTVDCVQVVFYSGTRQHLDYVTRNIIQLFASRSPQTILTALDSGARFTQYLVEHGRNLALGRRIVFYGGYEPDAADEAALRSLGVMAVVIGRARPGCSIPQIAGNHEYGCLSLTRHLLSLGHKRIAFIATDPERHVTHQSIFAGYRRALAEHGVPYDPALVSGTMKLGMPAGEEAARALLARNTGATAVVSVTAWVTCGAVKAFREAGLSVPEDMAVGMYFHQPWVDEACRVPMTGVSEFNEMLGTAAVEALEELSTGHRVRALTEVSNICLTVRRSCGAVK